MCVCVLHISDDNYAHCTLVILTPPCKNINNNIKVQLNTGKIFKAFKTFKFQFGETFETL